MILKFSLILVILARLSLVKTISTRTPGGCGNDAYADKFSLYVSQSVNPENRWVDRYKGPMLWAFIPEHSIVKSFSWKIKLGNGDISFSFERSLGLWTAVSEIYGKFKVENSVGEFSSTYIYSYFSLAEEATLDTNFDLEFSLNDYISTKKCAINNFTFSECQTTVPNLKVVSTASSYKDTGTFKCEDGYEIKRNNINSLNTECLKNATWKNEHLYECWGAPKNVKVVGNLDVREGSVMNISCSYDKSVPVVNYVKYCIGEICYQQSKSVQFFYKSVKLKDDGIDITCQPISEYTILTGSSNKGISPVRYLNVIFPPVLVEANLTSIYCKWYLGLVNNSCKFEVRSKPKVTNVVIYHKNSKTANSQAIEDITKVSIVDKDVQDYSQLISIELLQDSITKNKTFNATIQLKESSKFSDEMLKIPLQIVVFVPYNFKFLKAANNSNSVVVGVIVFLLVLAAVVGVVWKFKVGKSKEKPMEKVNEANQSFDEGYKITKKKNSYVKFNNQSRNSEASSTENETYAVIENEKVEKQKIQETYAVVDKNNTKQQPDNYSGETYAVVNKKDKNETALNDVYAEVNKETKPDVYAEVNKSK